MAHRSIAVALALWIGATVAPLHSQEGAETVAGRAARRGSEGSAQESTAVAGEAPRHRWIVRGDALGLFSTGDEAGVFTFVPDPFPEARTQKSVSGGLGFGLELEYLVKRRVGIDLAALFGDFDSSLLIDTGELRLRDDQDIGFMAVSLGVNYHLTPNRRADLYVGAFAQLSDYDDVIYRFPEAGRRVRRSFDDDPGWGLKAGVDVAFKEGDPWILAVAVRHLRSPLDIKPAILSIGIGYRWPRS